MNTFTTALKGEYIKKKGTGLFWLAAGMGAFMPIVYAIVMIVQYTMGSEKADAIPYNYFTKIMEEMLGGYAQFFFPLFIIIAVSRITQTDHRNGGWQLMETQPIKRWDIYSAKLTMILTANLISILSLIIMSYVGGGITLLFTEAPKAATFGFEAGAVLKIVLRLFVTGLFFTALQYMISVLIPSFVWSILIGFFMLLGYLFLSLFKVLPAWYPLNVIGHVADFKKGSELGYPITITELASLVLAILMVYIGFNWYRHKGFKAAFFGSGKRIGAFIATLVVTLGITAFMFSPKSTARHNKTIISGAIDSKNKIHSIVITDLFISDTIAIIPVTDNKFHYELKQDIPLDSYRFVLDNGLNGNIIFGTKDSININVKQYGKALETKVTGTRLAENAFNEKQTPAFSMVQFSLDSNSNLDNVTSFSSQLYKEWKEDMEETSKFRTADNYVPGPDYITKLKKIRTLTFLNYWQDFLKKRKVMFPGKATTENADIAEVKKMVPLDDASMLGSEDYFNYVRSLMIFKDETDTDENTKALHAIAKLKPGIFKDKMMVWQLRNSLREASDASERETLVNDYAHTFTNGHFTQNVLALNKTLGGIDKGKSAPAIALSDLKGVPVSLEQFKGKYLAIDVWATWCGPCRQESPYFEKLAIKYKGENIQFAAISTDQQMDKWFLEAKLKSKSVLQLHSDNGDKFSEDYDIQGIPRFILIDNEGNIVNADMPRPSEKTFEQVIRRELGMKEL
ncbi:redoxin family protein [Flavobacterium sp. RHBU_3]|uniref:redoxin family protein n=1 Tax=Flavobacterium sp. RHBU_3 TaxID=3391184 RepID=UPI003984641A